MTEFRYERASLELLAKYHYKMKSAMSRANQTDDEINRRRDLLKEWCAQKQYTRGQTLAYMAADAELRNLLDDFSFYSAEVQRFNAMIQAELSMYTLHRNM